MKAHEQLPDVQKWRDKMVCVMTPLTEGEKIKQDTFDKTTCQNLRKHLLRVVMV